MLKHYLKFAIRNFRSNKVIFVGSLATLCLGALCISLLFSYVHNELTMDDFHKNEENIYMLIMKKSPKSEWLFPFKFNAQDYPEVENATSTKMYREDDVKIKFNEFTYTPKGIVADSSFFKVFDFKLTIGNKKTLLADAEAIILSEALSKKIFGKTNPIGQKVNIEMHMHQGPHIVKGIVKTPSNSSLKFDYIIPNGKREYGRVSIPFVRLKKGFSKNEFNQKIKKSNNKVPNFYPQLTESITKVVNFNELYFSTDYNTLKKHSLFSSGNKKNIDILIIIIFVILFISILNYSNLQIVNTNSVIKNIAISKINGALKKHIYYQKSIENIIIIGITVLIISIAYSSILPFFNAFVEVNLAPPIWKVILINAMILLAITSIGLIYPMVIINRFSTIKNIKQNSKGSQQIKGKHVIVIAQYALTFILLISSGIVHKQLQLILNKDLGFNSDNIMKIKLFYEPPYNPESRNWSEEKRKQEYEKIKKIPAYITDRLASISSIEKLSQGRSPIDISPMDWKLLKKDHSDYKNMNSLVVTPNHLNMFDFEIINGRFFDKDIDEQRGNKILINEAAKLYFGITKISTTRLRCRSWARQDGNGFEIIGVVKDFNSEHLSSKPKPLIMVYFEDPGADYFIKFHHNKNEDGIEQIQNLFNEINPTQTFKYSFLSDEIAALYQKEKRLSTIYIVFTIIALLISAIGLFTIALYDTQRRVKEIGINKVNGATTNEIMLMLNKDFIKWVAIAFVIACPIAYYAMSKWLENFAYKTTLSWWVFALAGVFTLVIALLTVSWQSYRAATRNPVESLRDE